MIKLFEKKELQLKYFILFLFLVSAIVFFEAWQNWTSLLMFIISYILAVVLMILDEKYFYSFYQESSDDPVEDLMQQNQEKMPFLISRSFYFVLAIPAFSIYVLTSTGSVAAIAFVMAINLTLLVEMLQLRTEYLVFKDRFFRDLNQKLSQKDVNRICLLAIVYFLFLLLKWYF